MSKTFAWSYSRLTNYEQCPKKFYHTSVAKDYKEPESDAMRYGKRVHKALELRVGEGKPLSGDLQFLEPIAAKFANASGTKYAEQQLALDDNFKPCGWFDKTTWIRAIIDLAIVSGDRALLVDWKTGKMSGDFTQQQVAACIFFIFHPEVNTIDLMYYWIKDRKATTETLTREDTKHVWSPLMKRVRKYTLAHTLHEFPPRTSGLCKNHCPVKSCPHNGG